MKAQKLNILLVYPEIPTTYWSFDHTRKFLRKKGLMPPLGLITVAALLPEYFNCTLVDMNIEELRFEDVCAADMVFISAMIVQKESFKRAVKICNEAGTTVVAGGPYPTALHETIEGVDHFILNEAEVTLPMFLEDFEAGNLQRVYSNETKPSLTESPVPRFDLLDINAYTDMAIQTSRGCPFNCEFCDIIEMFGRNPRYKTPEQVCTELEALQEAGYHGPVFIVDDNFIGNKRVVKELLRYLIVWQKEHGFPFTFFTEASINLADDNELMDLMVEAKFETVFVGIETPDMESLKMACKNQNLKGDLLVSVDTIQKKGIDVMAGFILGFDSDRDDIFERQIDFIQKASIPLAMVGLLVALPNTQLYRRLEREGRILHESDGNNTHIVDTNFVPAMPLEKLVAGYQRVISEIYRPDRYLERCLAMIKKFPREPMSYYEANLNELRAFVVSFFELLFTPFGIHYLKYLLKIIISKPRHFGTAVSLALKGYHFYTISKDIMVVDSFTTFIERIEKSLEAKFGTMLRKGRATARWRMKLYGRLVMRKIRLHYSFMNHKVKTLIEEKYTMTLKKFEGIITRYTNYSIGKDDYNVRKAS